MPVWIAGPQTHDHHHHLYPYPLAPTHLKSPCGPIPAIARRYTSANTSTALKQGARGDEPGPRCSHARASLQKASAVLPARPNYSSLPISSCSATRFTGAYASLFRLITQSATATGRGCVRRRCVWTVPSPLSNTLDSPHRTPRPGNVHGTRTFSSIPVTRRMPVWNTSGLTNGFSLAQSSTARLDMRDEIKSSSHISVSCSLYRRKKNVYLRGSGRICGGRIAGGPLFSPPPEPPNFPGVICSKTNSVSHVQASGPCLNHLPTGGCWTVLVYVAACADPSMT